MKNTREQTQGKTAYCARSVNLSHKKYAIGRKANITQHQRILMLRQAGYTIAMTAKLAECSISHVKHITAMNRGI
jgi:hypothetical protein